MRVSEVDILIVPGWMNSGPDHWQSRWEAKLSTSSRIDLPDFYRPICKDWNRAIVEAVFACARPALLVAHGLGALAVAHAARGLPAGKVIGAWLAAPPDLESAKIQEAFYRFGAENVDATPPQGFSSAPMELLPFPALIIASRDDPFCTLDRAGAFARAWGAKLTDAGEAGHINASSGYGPWPDGVLRLAAFLREIGAQKGGLH